MKTLKDYIKSKSEFTVGGTKSNKLLIFDVDDTLIHTSANILINKNGKHIKTIPNKEFNTYKLRPGEEFDFSEFEDPNILSKEVFTNILKTTLGKKYEGKIYSEEIGLPIKDSELVLPCGIYSRYESYE